MQWEAQLSLKAATKKTNTHICWSCVESGLAACQQVNLVTDQLCRTNFNVLAQLLHGDVWATRRGEGQWSNQAADVSSILPRKRVFSQTQHLKTTVRRRIKKVSVLQWLAKLFFFFFRLEASVSFSATSIPSLRSDLGAAQSPTQSRWSRRSICELVVSAVLCRTGTSTDQTDVHMDEVVGVFSANLSSFARQQGQIVLRAVSL